MDSGAWTGLFIFFIFSLDGFICHTHIHTLNSAECILWCLHLTEGDISGEKRGSVKTWHTVRVEWLFLKSTAGKQIFIRSNFPSGCHKLKGEVHQKEGASVAVHSFSAAESQQQNRWGCSMCRST